MASINGVPIPPGISTSGWNAQPQPDGGLWLSDEGGTRPGLKVGGVDGWRPGAPIPDWIYSHYQSLPAWFRADIEAPPAPPGQPADSAPLVPLSAGQRVEGGPGMTLLGSVAGLGALFMDQYGDLVNANGEVLATKDQLGWNGFTSWDQIVPALQSGAYSWTPGLGVVPVRGQGGAGAPSAPGAAVPPPMTLSPMPGATPGPPAAPGATTGAPAPSAGSPASERQAFLSTKPGPPISLTGPGAETPFGQVAGQVLGRGYLPALEFLELMTTAEVQRLQGEEQRLINAATIAAQQGNMQIATQNAQAARDVALRAQELTESTARIQNQIAVANAEAQRNVAMRDMTVQEKNAITQRDVAGRGMALQEQVTPYQAATQRMVGLAPLATSPLVNWYTARGEAPPQIIQDLMRYATQAPGAAPSSGLSLLSTTPATPAATATQQATWSMPATREPNKLYALSAPGGPQVPAAPSSGASAPSPPGAPFVRALAGGTTLPAFTGQVGPYAPPLPGGAQWASMTPGEQAGTQDLFASFGTPPEDFAAMLRKSLPPGGPVSAGASFVSALR